MVTSHPELFPIKQTVNIPKWGDSIPKWEDNIPRWVVNSFNRHNTVCPSPLASTNKWEVSKWEVSTPSKWEANILSKWVVNLNR
jgi:hypothetical protein